MGPHCRQRNQLTADNRPPQKQGVTTQTWEPHCRQRNQLTDNRPPTGKVHHTGMGATLQAEKPADKTTGHSLARGHHTDMGATLQAEKPADRQQTTHRQGFTTQAWGPHCRQRNQLTADNRPPQKQGVTKQAWGPHCRQRNQLTDNRPPQKQGVTKQAWGPHCRQRDQHQVRGQQADNKVPIRAKVIQEETVA